MDLRLRGPLAALTLALVAAPVASQTFPDDDPILQNIWTEGMERSQVYPLAQALLDSVGPRLTGTPGLQAAHDWAVHTYESWGVEARNEQYGTWMGWRRGISHVDLLEPRVRSLEGMLLGWSGGTPNGEPVEGEVIAMPEFESAAEVEAWLPSVAGKFVAIAFPEPTCRPDDQWAEYARPADFEAMRAERSRERGEWNNARFLVAPGNNGIQQRLEEAGALGLFESRWSNAPGTNKVFSASTQTIPTFDVSCEDYGLLFRLAENGQSPRVRVQADAEFLGDVPTFNTIATIPGTELPDEYVVLSAHFDSWDGGSGATDNGTGTVTMMEALRILNEVLPNPRRTILVGHWGGEEQGLNGSRAFAADHPEVVEGMQVLLNQDNGTGRVQNISMQGLIEAGGQFATWLSKVPSELSGEIDLNVPGSPGGGGSDYAAFICAGAPAFSLSSLSWGYGTYTWHTNRDTFDKVVISEVQENATLTAMLAYLASEDPQRVSRVRRSNLGTTRGGAPMEWPTCRDGARTYGN
ncbi:M20/M25/M40 family metallo-hydrolase [Gaopeijia maritima]|uniref:M20/M25/M40 family metallo-hydrolase n=1 Tax=Gaopeijia maritima TaxID=3119007 RepID=UPI0032836E46